MKLPGKAYTGMVKSVKRSTGKKISNLLNMATKKVTPNLL